MTELETMQRAKMYMDKLANGIDPIKDTELPGDSALNNVRLARCFFYVSDVLGRVIENGGNVGAKPKTPKLPEFSATAEAVARVPISQEPLRITQFVEHINAVLGNPQMKKLSTTTITNWLLSKGILEKRAGADGNAQRLPTETGIMLGLFMEVRRGQYGEYTAVLYGAEAQKFILDNLEAILEEKRTAAENTDI